MIHRSLTGALTIYCGGQLNRQLVAVFGSSSNSVVCAMAPHWVYWYWVQVGVCVYGMDDSQFLAKVEREGMMMTEGEGKWIVYILLMPAHSGFV